MSHITQQEQNKGIYFALAAFLMWGIAPLYFKAVAEVSALEILAHRIIWSVAFMLLFLMFTGRLKQLTEYKNSPRTLLILGLTAVIISVNWLVFIWATAQGRLTEATLGYFINPLISIVFGLLFFSEQLRRLQWLAVAIATIAVAYQIILLGELPWVAMTLAISFALYGALRKKIVVDSITGLLIETLWLSPLALGYMIWLYSQSELQLLSADLQIQLLLLAAGIVTSLPLIAFASGARRLSLTTIGLIQYIAPSLAFLIAVFYFNEPMNQERLVTFVLIWIALAIFSVEGILVQRRKRKAYNRVETLSE